MSVRCAENSFKLSRYPGFALRILLCVYLFFLAYAYDVLNAAVPAYGMCVMKVSGFRAVYWHAFHSLICHSFWLIRARCLCSSAVYHGFLFGWPWACFCRNVSMHAYFSGGVQCRVYSCTHRRALRAACAFSDDIPCSFVDVSVQIESELVAARVPMRGRLRKGDLDLDRGSSSSRNIILPLSNGRYFCVLSRSHHVRVSGRLFQVRLFLR